METLKKSNFRHIAALREIAIKKFRKFAVQIRTISLSAFRAPCTVSENLSFLKASK